MQSEPSLDSAVAISMLRRLDAAGPAGEMPFHQALACASTITHGHGQELLSSLTRGKLIVPVGKGAIGLVRLTAVGREALETGGVPMLPPARGPCSVDPSARDVSDDTRPVDETAERSTSMMREHAGFLAALAAGIITVAGVLEAIGVPDAQSSAAQSHGALDLWGDAWFVVGIAIGTLGVILLFAAAGLYFKKRRRR